MGMLDNMIGSAILAKASQAVQAAEVKRRLETRKVVLELARSVAAGAHPDAAVEAALQRVLAAATQGPAVRGIAQSIGHPMATEVLNKVADKLEGR